MNRYLVEAQGRAKQNWKTESEQEAFVSSVQWLITVGEMAEKRTNVNFDDWFNKNMRKAETSDENNGLYKLHEVEKLLVGYRVEIENKKFFERVELTDLYAERIVKLFAISDVSLPKGTFANVKLLTNIIVES